MQLAIWKFRRFFFALLLFTGFSVQAQPPVQVPTMQNPSEVNPGQFDPKNLSQPQLRSLLEDKNRETGKDKNSDIYSNGEIEKDSTQRDDLRRRAYSPLRTYGEDVFSNTAVTDLSELSTPPLDYPIGVGDHVIVALWGAAEFQENYVVARDGSIFPNSLGKINVAGLTFENMRAIVYSRFQSVSPPGTNISVSIGQPRSINVNVVGEVQDQGPQTVSAFSNAFNVIARAGGVTRFGNLRNIQIKRGGRVIDELDVYKYLTSGDFGKHIYLQNNDFIIVGTVEKKVLATGQFKRPMYYQLRADEGVKALLKYSGGLNPDALGSSMKILRTENEAQVLKNVNANAIVKIAGQDFALEDGDIVKVDLIKPGIANKVELRGEVSYPDYYELRPGDRLFDVINRAGGVTRNTYLPRAYVFRGAGDSTNLQSDRLEVDLSDINENKANSPSNVSLQPNDVIQLFSQSEFGDPQYVEIYGEIRKEGRFRKYGGMSLEDLLYLSGGIKQSAEFGRLEIASIVDVDSARQGLKPTRTIIKSYAIQPDLQLDSAAAKIRLKPYDQVFVRKNPTFELQQNIELKGLVKYPGLYARLNKYERLSSYLDRAGGLKDNANLAGAVLYRTKTEFFREKVVEKPKLDTNGRPIMDSAAIAKAKAVDEPVSIDLYKALKYRNSKYDIILQENDMIFVPEINPFVSVQGKVQSPLKIAFDKEHTNLSYYIDKAGGFGIRPWRKRIYVTYANGKSKRTRSFAFFHFYPKVDEGSIVTVPERPQGQEGADFAKSALLAAIPVLMTAVILKYVN
ncbi:MAG: capsule polysaccharide export protein [Ferruginibacter sp.]|nr:capsule polysaccharide export protein [Ferruginibacter sp.]